MAHSQIRRGLLTMLAVAALAGVAGPVATAWSPSPAAGLTVKLTVGIGKACFVGSASGPSARITIVQRRQGVQIAQAQRPSSSSFSVCLEPTRVGDVLAFRKGGQSTTLKVPNVRLILDPVASRLNGRVPASKPSATIAIYDWYTGDAIPKTGRIRSDGTFSLATGPLQAADWAQIIWVGPDGSLWDRRASVPGFIVREGKAKATVFGATGSTVTLTLKAPSNVTRGTATVTLQDLSGEVTLRKDGDPVTVATGDSVSISGYAGTLTVLPDDLQLSPENDGTITATCAPSARWTANARLGSEAYGPTAGTADGSGLVSGTGAWPNTGTLPTGITVTLDCQAPNGLIQRMVETTP